MRDSDSDEKIQDRLEIANREIDQSKIEGFHDLVIINDDLNNTVEQIEKFVYRGEAEDETSIGPEANSSKSLSVENVFESQDTNGVDGVTEETNSVRKVDIQNR